MYNVHTSSSSASPMRFEYVFTSWLAWMPFFSVILIYFEFVRHFIQSQHNSLFIIFIIHESQFDENPTRATFLVDHIMRVVSAFWAWKNLFLWIGREIICPKIVTHYFDLVNEVRLVEWSYVPTIDWLFVCTRQHKYNM